MHIYRWLNTQRARKEGTEVELNSLPELETKKKWTLKIHPGVLLPYVSRTGIATDATEQVSRHSERSQKLLDPTTLSSSSTMPSNTSPMIKYKTRPSSSLPQQECASCPTSNATKSLTTSARTYNETHNSSSQTAVYTFRSFLEKQKDYTDGLLRTTC